MMAKVAGGGGGGGGGLLRLDAICAKLKNCKGDASTGQKTTNGEKLEILEANNNEKLEDCNEEVLQNGDEVKVNGAEETSELVESTIRERTPSPLALVVNTPLSTGGSSRRKNKRKNFRPKNISQFDEEISNLDDCPKDELEEYEANNQGIDFSAVTVAQDEEEEEQQEAPLALTNYEKRLSVDGGAKENAEFSMDNCGALDLSTSRAEADEDAGREGDNAEEGEEEGQMEEDGPEDLSMKSSDSSTTSPNKRPNPEISPPVLSTGTTSPGKKSTDGMGKTRDASAMKDYAESTMNELMSIYGFNSEAESITQGVPLEKFESVSILERNNKSSPSSASSGTPFSLASVLQQSSLHMRNAGPSNKDVAGHVTAALATRVGATSTEGGKSGEGLLAKFVDSITQLSKLPREPPVLIPTSATVTTATPSGVTASQKSIPTTNGSAASLPGKSPGKPSAAASNFATSAAYIKAVFDPTLGPKLAAAAASGGKNALPDYSRYVKRYQSYEDCGGNHCHDMGYKEHFHCMDCSFRVFVKKEEMIRHFKWHKKRDESLQHGFMRYSPMDDCTEKFGPCTHNGRQTHYHCLQSGCSKVYISTSDVQMHANYHRKDSAIIQEGFQRFRATEDCGTPTCAFYGQRTTHFHCRRGGCTFTFKNKADMEKHKTYHQKDEMLARDGFKKFMKYESCNYKGCRYSKVSNHIHCTRRGCDYVLHSTGQLYPHKRKHERRDFEHAYKRFKEEQKQKPMLNPAIQQQMGVHPSTTSGQTFPGGIKREKEFVDIEEFARMNKFEYKAEEGYDSEPADFSRSSSPFMGEASSMSGKGIEGVKLEQGTASPNKAQASTLAKLASKLNGQSLNDSLNLPIPTYGNKMKSEAAAASEEMKEQATPMNLTSMGFKPKVSPPVNEKKERDESWKKYLIRYTANDPCHSRCQFLYKDHYHCNVASCGMLFKSKDGVREHAKQHETQDRITSLSFMVYNEDVPCVENCHLSKEQKHYHCLWADCKHVISEKDPVFSRLEHHKIHEFARNVRKNPGLGHHSSEFNLRRRRGRPPKYPKNEIPVVPKIEMTEEEIAAAATEKDSDAAAIAHGFQKFELGQPCPDDKCMYFMRQHYHCLRKRCHHSTDRADVLTLHAKDFHNYVIIMEGFEFFDRNVNCRRPHCHNNKANRHYHCVRPRCDYSFVRHSTMAQHDHKHKMAEMGLTPSPSIAIPKSAIMPQAVTAVPVAMQSVALPVGAQVLVSSPGGTTSVTTATKQMITAAGTFYPMTAVPGGTAQVLMSSGAPQMAFTLPAGMQTAPPALIPIPVTSTPTPIVIQPLTTVAENSVATSPNLVTIAPKPQRSPPTNKPVAPPLSVLLQQKAPNALPQLNWLNMKMKMHYGMHQNCGRPFCKLKKKDHYHCFHCNQAFSDPMRLKSHILKQGVNLEKIDVNKSFAFNAGDAPPGENDDDESGDPDRAEVTSEAEMSAEDPEETETDLSSSLNLTIPVTALAAAAEDDDEGDNGDADDEEDSQGHNNLVIDFSRSGQGQSQTRSSTEDMEEEMTGVETPDDTKGTDVSDSGDTTPARRSRRKRTATRHEDFIDSDAAISSVKRQRVSLSPRHSGETYKPTTPTDLKVNHSSNSNGKTPTSPKTAAAPRAVKTPRAKKDDPVPEGCNKFRWSDDCGFERCAYRLSQSHYHCTRESCGYAFSDRSRFLQHLDRHKRLDGVMGDEFKMFRMGQDCGRPDCEHTQKASHYHCVKCPFICTDTSKVTAHRKHHSKMELISAQGFTKFSIAEQCGREGCHYNKTHTHYHCLECNYVAIGPAQMNPHKLKHVKQSQLDTPSNA